MFSKVGKIVGGIFAVFVVLALIGACFGDDEGDSDYLAWLNKQHPNYILEKVEHFEGKPTIAGAPDTELGKTLKVTQIARTYKIKDDYKPESEWGRIVIPELIFTASTPKGVGKIRVSHCMQLGSMEWWFIRTREKSKQEYTLDIDLRDGEMERIVGILGSRTTYDNKKWLSTLCLKVSSLSDRRYFKFDESK